MVDVQCTCFVLTFFYLASAIMHATKTLRAKLHNHMHLVSFGYRRIYIAIIVSGMSGSLY